MPGDDSETGQRRDGSVVVLGNPSARGGREQLDAVDRLLRARGVEPRVIAAASPSESLSAARRAVADGASRLIAVGGDGMVSIAVNAVATNDTVLGVVPDGTGNDFARALGLLEGDLADHVARATGDPVAVDGIRTDHGWVASVATLGFSGDVTARANTLAWPRGQRRYTVATLLQLSRLATYRVEVDVDGERFADSNTLLAIGNTEYFGGGMRICPGARADDGLLHVVNIGDVPRRTFLRVFPKVFSGRHVDHPEVATRTGTTVSLAGDADLWADGELLGPLPVTLEAVPGAFLVAGVAGDAGVAPTT